MGIKQKLGEAYWRFRSAQFDYKIIVIESDDWGSLRTESLAQRNALNKLGAKVQKDPYVQLDGLADVEDLNALFEVLASVIDEQGNHASITANVCMANPDFEKIKSEGFEEFYYESFDQTIARKNNGAEILQLWQEGQCQGLFQPQLHGREHLHGPAWLAELRNGNADLLNAFDLKTWGIPYQASLQQRRKNLQAALDSYNLPYENEFQSSWLKESAKNFEDYFGFKSKTFIAPAYVWHSKMNEDFKRAGIQSLQGIKLQYQPKVRGYKRKMRFMGEQDTKYQLYYFPRNVFFEPSLFPDKDWYSETMKGIEKAFANNQPAIIGSHRINFIGKITEPNRAKSLKILKLVLEHTLRDNPEAIFISSDQLKNYL